MKRVFSSFILFAVVSFVMSCKEDEYDKTAIVRFEVAEAVYTEDVLNVRIGVALDRERNVNTVIKGTWQALDTTSFYGGDFTLSDECSIRAFNTTSYFQMGVINDMQLDADDRIRIKLLKPIDEKVRLSDNPSETEFTLTLKSNDVVPNYKLQADLTWHLQSLHSDVSEIVNLDLYLQSDVVIQNNAVVDIGNTVTSSDQPLGFETLWLSANEFNRDYFIVVYFQRTLVGEVVTYNLTLNGMGLENKHFGDRLADDELGAIFIGPFSKTDLEVQYNGRAKNREVRKYFVPRSVIQGKL